MGLNAEFFSVSLGRRNFDSPGSTNRPFLC